MGDATAQAELGDVFSDQKFGHVDFPQAVIWYRKAAEQGQREGQFGLGLHYLLGKGVPQDKAEAQRWLTPAADRGHPYAQLLLGRMFEQGDGVAPDAVAAAHYYELAANFGLPRAQYWLGLMLAANRSDVMAAYKWLVLAQDVVKESAAPAQDLRKTLTVAQIAQAEREIDEWRKAHHGADLNP
jgi:TPR repeat protein